MKPALLDVNVLVALLWPAYEFHGTAQRWFARNSRHAWVTCPFTQADFPRRGCQSCSRQNSNILIIASGAMISDFLRRLRAVLDPLLFAGVPPAFPTFGAP